MTTQVATIKSDEGHVFIHVTIETHQHSREITKGQALRITEGGIFDPFPDEHDYEAVVARVSGPERYSFKGRQIGGPSLGLRDVFTFKGIAFYVTQYHDTPSIRHIEAEQAVPITIEP